MYSNFDISYVEKLLVKYPNLINYLDDELLKNKINYPVSNNILEVMDLVSKEWNIYRFLKKEYKLNKDVCLKALSNYERMSVPSEMYIYPEIASIVVKYNSSEYYNLPDNIKNNIDVQYSFFVKDTYLNKRQERNIKKFINVFHYGLFNDYNKFKRIYYDFKVSKNGFNIFDLDYNSFDNLINILNTKELDLNTFNSIYDLISLKEFISVLNNNEYNFIKILDLCKNKNPELINRITKLTINYPNIINILYKHHILSIKDFINGLYNDNKDYINILHDEILRDYFNNLRDEYIKEKRNSINLNTNKDKVYNDKDLYRELLKNSNEDIINIIFNNSSILTINVGFINSRNKVNELINYLRKPIGKPSSDIKLFKDIIKYLVNNNYLDNLIDLNKVNYSYEINKNSGLNVLDLLYKLNCYSKEELVKISNFKYYNELKLLFDKYRLSKLNNVFNNSFNNLNIVMDNSLIASLIINFDKVYSDYLKLNNSNNRGLLIDLLNNLRSYGSSMNKYNSLMEHENFSLFVANTSMYRASIPFEERISLVPKYIKEMYLRKEVSVPPMDKVFVINGKKIRVTIGNYTDPINLTLGERSMCCARIGGEGKYIFDMAISHKQGLNIIFRDYETDEFISKAAGFRNGNTLFLNQLRHSMNNKYSNNDLRLCLSMISKELVEISRINNDNLDNVITSPTECFENMDGYNLGLDYESGYRDGILDNGGCDIDNNYKSVIIIKNKPINFKEPIKKYYKVIRRNIKMITNKIDIINEMNRLHFIDGLINNKDLNNLDYYNYDVNNIDFMIVGEDYYLCFNNNGILINEFIINDKDRFMSIKEEINNIFNTNTKLRRK